MVESKVILITGASRGIGYAITKYLLGQKHKLVLTSRSSQALEDIKSTAPDQIEVVAGDITDNTLPLEAVTLAVKKFGRLDGLVLNHGTLGEVKRVVDSEVEGWIRTFDTNFFSCIAVLQHAVPHLRKTQGRIIFTSSGAAAGAYSTWGPYGASKAALNHLALTLRVEEPDVTTIAIRPGVVDSDMQKEIREVHGENMDAKDRKKFNDAHTQGTLLKPEQPGNVIAKLVVSAGKELNGQFLSWDDKSLAAFQG